MSPDDVAWMNSGWIDVALTAAWFAFVGAIARRWWSKTGGAGD